MFDYAARQNPVAEAIKKFWSNNSKAAIFGYVIACVPFVSSVIAFLLLMFTGDIKSIPGWLSWFLYLAPITIGLVSILVASHYSAEEPPPSRGEQVLAEDSRPPILYLRPFKSDVMSIHVEEYPMWLLEMILRLLLSAGLRTRRRELVEDLLLEPLKNLGPIVAIGDGLRPGGLGAARIHARDDNWKPLVTSLASEARLIVMYGGNSGSTGRWSWSLDKTFVPIIFVLPTKLRGKEWERFFFHWSRQRISSCHKIFRHTLSFFLSNDRTRTRSADVIEVLTQLQASLCLDHRFNLLQDA
jgi:hypothetical protein